MGSKSAATARATFTKSRRPHEPEINVTPLVDVVLVLLIIFMVIAPNLQEGLPVELPEAGAVDTKKPEPTVEVVMTPDGALHLEDEEIAEPALVDALRAKRAERAETKIVLKADAGLPYAKVRSVFASLSNAGLTGVSLKVAARRDGES